MRRLVSLVATVLAVGVFALGAFALIVAQEEEAEEPGGVGACATPGATPLATPLASPAASPVASPVTAPVASPCPEVGTPVGAQVPGDAVTGEMVDITSVHTRT